MKKNMFYKFLLSLYAIFCNFMGKKNVGFSPKGIMGIFLTWEMEHSPGLVL